MDNDVQRTTALVGLNRRTLLQIGGASALGLLLASCASRGPVTVEQPAGDPIKGGTLIFSTNLDISTLDPAFSHNFSDRFAYYAIYDTLVAYDTNFNITPSLAESWEESDEGKVLTLHLKQGVKFHDGTPFNADAVKWNLERIMNPDTNSSLRGLVTPPLSTITVVDDSTVQLNLETAWRPLLAVLGERPGFMVSPTAVENLGEDFARNPVGTGAFKFVSWVQDSELKLERNEDYWNADAIHLDGITFKHTPEDQVRLTMIRTGEAHIANTVTPQLAQTVAGDPSVVLKEGESGAWFSVQMNNGQAPFDKVEVRQAIAHATNRDGVKNALFLDKARVATGPIGVGWALDENRTEPMFGYDLEKAAALVTAAGAAGKTANFANGSQTDYQAIAQLLQEDYAKIGLDLKPSTVPESDWYDQVMEGKVTFAVVDWTPRADVDGLLRILFHSKGTQNSTGYSNPEVDRLLDEAAAILDPEEAAPTYKKIQDILEHDAPYVWIVWPNFLTPHNAKLGGVQLYPDGVYRLREMWIEQ